MRIFWLQKKNKWRKLSKIQDLEPWHRPFLGLYRTWALLLGEVRVWEENQKDLRVVCVVTASRLGLVWGFTPGLDLGACSTPGRVSQYEAGFWKTLTRRPLHVVACVLVHWALHSEIGRPWENVCDSSKVLSVVLVNLVFFLWFKVHITKLSNLKTSVIDYNVRAEILSMGMGIDNSEHVEQLKKLYKGAKMPSFEESLNQTL